MSQYWKQEIVFWKSPSRLFPKAGTQFFHGILASRFHGATSLESFASVLKGSFEIAKINLPFSQMISAVSAFSAVNYFIRKVGSL
jgi:hypothetical protein